MRLWAEKEAKNCFRNFHLIMPYLKNQVVNVLKSFVKTERVKISFSSIRSWQVKH